ncbi:phosphatidylinositol phosphate synthase [Ruania alba]|uniref:Phosphatidylinositol phosphate synthase n=1 Tax=Ruania alba TaxID=648782 RepID=A0A1H5FPZ2_9MICO|nr:CDP-alcohol phosphatidyltransferase family protein [Ruania alba]SEE04978.1 CDP-diacylglycerol inositol 3-phosphatidyltransferase [Ruania alba]
MVLGRRGRGLTNAMFGPLARALVSAGVSPNAVTVAGAVGVVTAALWLFPTGHLAVGAVVIGLLALTDSVDGLMARERGQTSDFGAFLDSALDRVSDAAVFIGLSWYLVTTAPPAWQLPGLAAGTACLVLGMLVSYVRARAEGLGFTAKVGIAERADRLIVALVATLAVGLGLPDAVLVVTFAVLAVASAVTVVQRILTVHRQSRRAGTGEHG